MKVHITLIGGQTMPVFLGIDEVQPDKVIMIHSGKTKEQAERISKVYQRVPTELHLFDPVNISSIKDKVVSLLNEYRDDDVTINLSSGTKPWSIAFAIESAKFENVVLLYIDQNCNVYDLTNNRIIAARSNLDISTLIKYNSSQKPISYSKLSDYNDEDLKTLKIVEQLHNKYPRAFKFLTIPDKSWKKELAGGNEGKHTLDNGSYIQWKKSTHTVTLHIIASRNKQEDTTLNSLNAVKIVFNTGWFEYKIAEMISHWKHAKEVWINVVYPYFESQPKNEIDIMVSTGNRLLMIECKTQIFDNTDIDKFHSAVKNFGGMGCKALFVTEAKMKTQAREKCKDNDIISFSLSDFSSIEDAQKALFSLLKKEMLKLNAR